jgi:hypothetical protein
MARPVPMLAVQETPDFQVLWDKGFFPLGVCDKVDGIRGWNWQGWLRSRSMKPLPSTFVQEAFGTLQGLDGELLPPDCPVGDNVRRESHSRVMTHRCTLPVDWHIFDYCPDESWAKEPRIERRARLIQFSRDGLFEHPRIKLMDLKMVRDPDELAIAEADALRRGYEGLCAYNMVAPYKFGRSTIGNSQTEGGIIKIKRVQEFEAVALDFIELMRNLNPQKENERGTNSRSSHKENLVPGGTLGAIRSRGLNGPFKDKEFNVGVFKGLSAEEKQHIWNHQEQFKMMPFTYITLPYGVKDLPVQPRWTNWRAWDDFA